ncbi:MerR family transcriptional regulator [Allostreptomyces psammosilenae]|uniref:DNA-binding transcriptional MerR regulator n=1 Tax=Allostreptomyces psammosilenae TaxID=1892865 RepID=A0A852ZSX0_9ACTN|nr:MerR family transcriptional regulator [Allostreptomyces psammosilenae]NYI05526.1 DNA-binding transcriptional MerR regulator [Allostreptomyces psammosilenae]
MKIGELSRATGVSVRLLRYYEEQELLSSHRTPGGHRTYAADAPQVVHRIRVLLDAGLPTRVIREVLPCVHGDGVRVDACMADHLRDQLRGIDQRIAELRDTRSSLAAILATTERLTERPATERAGLTPTA